jgi:cyclophilin family peptidyl-prolyl cis-trans isomerase
MDRTEEGDEASKTDEQPRPRPTPRRVPADTGPEPSIKPGSLSRTLGHIALTVLAVVVLYTAYQHSRRDDDNGETSTTTSTAAPTAEGQVTATTADIDSPQEPACPPDGGPSQPVWAFTGAPATLVNGALRGSCVLIEPGGSYVARVETTEGPFEITLDPAAAPATVNHFVFLARWRFYENSVFYHVAPGVTIDTGDPISQNGDGDPGYTMPNEGPQAPADPIMAVFMPGRAGEPNSVSSEFSIVPGQEGTGLVAGYTRIGRVTSGREAVQAIEATGDRDRPNDPPAEPTLIRRITIREE